MATLKEKATGVLMNVIGKMDLRAILNRRTDIALELNLTLRKFLEAVDWGIAFIDAGLGEIKIPSSVAEAMARQVIVTLMTQARFIEDVGTAKSLNAMQGIVSNPAILDRAVLLRILHGLTDAIAQRK